MKRLFAAVLLLLAVAGAAVALASPGQPSHPADRFLDRYVEDDGRVVRHDQGGDTVSEGQAYAMLLAAARGDEARFARVWDWTRTHLQRPDGLLAWRWADGRVAEDEAASDADLDAARALLVAADRFGEPSYDEAGRALGRAIVEHETTFAAERTVLVAGPWARAEAVVNPSYWSPRAFDALGFDQIAASSQRLLLRLTENGLPPDWARVHAWGVQPVGPPSGGEPGYSFDAVRVPLRLAESCDPEDHRLAAGLWPRLRDRPGASRRGLDGRPAGDDHAAALVGAAAAARAAGDGASSARLLDEAEALDEEQPTYYGAALVALGRVMLEERSLGPCP